MNYEELHGFVSKKMRLSQIYQPLLIKSLIEAGGTATVRQIATIFLTQDEGLIKRYEKKSKEMPIRVLSEHGVVKKQGDLVSLITGKLTLSQKAELKRQCEERLQRYVAQRGWGIWELIASPHVPGSLRTLVFKEAKGRCAACGRTKNESFLEIDHINPRSKKGEKEYSNLQVLCAICNRAKSDKSSTDFRYNIAPEYEEGCIFCEAPKTREIILENDLCIAILDSYPVTEAHTLVVPKRHVGDYFELSETERTEVNELMRIRRKQLLESDPSITGFNVGVNCGESAGQTVGHCHMHLIPRRKGDTPNPRGGVRGVIPNKMNYP
ncbi:HIT domain-containing protein [Bacteroidota bacterium]